MYDRHSEDDDRFARSIANAHYVHYAEFLGAFTTPAEAAHMRQKVLFVSRSICDPDLVIDGFCDLRNEFYDSLFDLPREHYGDLLAQCAIVLSTWQRPKQQKKAPFTLTEVMGMTVLYAAGENVMRGSLENAARVTEELKTFRTLASEPGSAWMPVLLGSLRSAALRELDWLLMAFKSEKRISTAYWANKDQ